ncbi:zinc finger protein MAGPIE [Malania oleifera]|uniref:zinc finger protein MAGPIE n=1 Tax=Malania oleifera TaxID=397392 RepID=UPI0025AEA48B|nr:zinc finger protein MAGPIE [Malania oleifera]
MFEKMEEAAISNGFIQNPVGGSNPPITKKKRNLPGTPDPDAEVIALSPKTLMATNRFLCEICGKGFQRDQNLQLHRRGHNLPWKLKQRSSKEPRKRVYVCPEKTCVHNHPSRALGDLTGIKKHFCRKHGEKKWKCEKCSKRYAVQSDWKAHSKTCGTREYKCDCGTIFSRRDSFITHRAFCEALAEETARINAANYINNATSVKNINHHFMIGSSLGPNMAQDLPIFNPISSITDETIEQSKRPGFSLQMGEEPLLGHESMGSNNLQEIHQLVSVSSGVMFTDPLIMCSNPLPPNYQLNWDFGSKLSSNNAEELTSSTSLPLSNNVKENGTEDQLVSVPSLYSTHHQSHQTHSANISATALLQKAAEIGAASSDPSFLGSFGIKCNNMNYVQDGNKFYGLMYGSNPMDHCSSIRSDVENSTNDLSTLNHLQMCPAKRQKTQSEESGVGQTRDFLGVGSRTICHPSSINGWI